MSYNLSLYEVAQIPMKHPEPNIAPMGHGVYC